MTLRLVGVLAVLSALALGQASRDTVRTYVLDPVVVPGLFLTEQCVLGYGVSNGAAGGLSIRGAGGSPNTEVLVLSDGRPQTMAGYPMPGRTVLGGLRWEMQ